MSPSEYLVDDNPMLLKLREDYRNLGLFEHSMWETWRERISLQNFRREGDYLAQSEYGMTPEHYWATYAYLLERPEVRYLELFDEDSLFGVTVHEIGGRVVTRDLLDSVLEIGFLQETLSMGGRDSISVLDIGAGYGRFAHRFTTAFPKSFVYCADGIPESSFLCDFYRRFRGFDSQSEIIWPNARPVDLAVNIHSWSECSLRSIRFWLDRLADLDVPYLFLVPHTEAMESLERDGSRVEFRTLIQGHGYRLIRERKKYVHPVMQRIGVYPATYYLFQR